MANTTTIARPYAKAIFELALTHQNLQVWSSLLMLWAQFTEATEVQDYLNNPNVALEAKTSLLMDVVGKQDSPMALNLIQILAHHKRLGIFPELLLQYQALREDFEKTLMVQVRSFTALSNEEEARLKTSLAKRLNRDIGLHVMIDPTLLGGAVIQAGDLVIDGSLLGKLNKLGAALAA